MKPALQSDASGARPAGSPPRLLYGDPMRVAGALAVIVFHVAAYGQDRRGAIGAAAWWGCNLVSCATLWCVPIFILLSGALLLDPERSDTLGGFYRRRLGRIGIPFLFWCAFYLAYRKVVLGTAFAQYRPAGPVGRFVVERIATATLGIYLIHPVFLHLARQMGLTGL